MEEIRECELDGCYITWHVNGTNRTKRFCSRQHQNKARTIRDRQRREQEQSVRPFVPSHAPATSAGGYAGSTSSMIPTSPQASGPTPSSFPSGPGETLNSSVRPEPTVQGLPTLHEAEALFAGDDGGTGSAEVEKAFESRSW